MLAARWERNVVSQGGMIPSEREESTKWYYQVIQSRYGFNPHHLMLVDAVERRPRRATTAADHQAMRSGARCGLTSR